ncbi:elongation factor 2 kinase, putative [Entamoeba invadens IP1]|uniref:Elongation factor 2 kinase, putative n=2 Tax=Entamoeba invadens TaxID=33085 RepID=A0A0A1UFE6_ENTIV|nr:elongation factor 2 kinase, putative [Entamoeba invadens IP1]ELP95213.1 elongation factor 2 kinase, putative [Entamoeba invadens IP1]BAN42485.1 elongation factor 2 kinase, putative [Entamoeba invadens]BAN42520.1 elongation factor 2 kinase, putative [Entamoeba invadens]|eukprot:XP_004261984.1 elongation factor 2 kinase, putative [Entamoeba invadens IP1]
MAYKPKVSQEMVLIAKEFAEAVDYFTKSPTPCDVSMFSDGSISIRNYDVLFVIDARISAKKYHYQMVQHILNIITEPSLPDNKRINVFIIRDGIEQFSFDNVRLFIGYIQMLQYSPVTTSITLTRILPQILLAIQAKNLGVPLFVHILNFQPDFIQLKDALTINPQLEILVKLKTTILYGLTSQQITKEFNDVYLGCLSKLEYIEEVNVGGEITRQIYKPIYPLSFTTEVMTEESFALIPMRMREMYPINFEDTEEMKGFSVTIDPTYFLNDACYEYWARPTKFLVEPVTIKKRVFPFARGAERNAYLGKEVSGAEEKIVVLKDFIKQRGKDVYQFLDILELNSAVEQLAFEFNQVCDTFKRINFVPVSIFVVCDTTLWNVKTLTYDQLKRIALDNKMYFIEPMLKGTFVKFNDNNSMVNTELYSATIQAFSHWSYFRTAKRLIVCDLQGIIRPDKNDYLLTDPAIHHESVTKYYFSLTNLSQRGMSQFFSTHQCNAVCHSLGIVDGPIDEPENSFLKTKIVM